MDSCIEQDYLPLVSICCTCYNHEEFIRQTLDGFLMQKTSFPFEIVIFDDASTDKTQEIILEYASKGVHSFQLFLQKENLWQNKGISGTIAYSFANAKGKYIALCEGDDYWTDPYKLQKQVDFMEANPEYTLCCHRYQILNEVTKEWNNDYGSELFEDGVEGIVFDNEINLLRFWLTKTMTVLFRRDKLDISIFNKYSYYRDVHLYYHLLKDARGYCINYDAAVYRIHDNGIYSTTTNLDRGINNYKIFSELYYFNREDTLLEYLFLTYKEKVLNTYIRPFFYVRKYSKELFNNTLYFVKSEYLLSGFFFSLASVIRITYSTMKGIFKLKK